MAPAIGILHTAPLNTGESIVQILSHRADLAAGDHIVLAAVAELADGGDNSSGTGAECLLQRAVLGSADELDYRAPGFPVLPWLAIVMCIGALVLVVLDDTQRSTLIA